MNAPALLNDANVMATGNNLNGTSGGDTGARLLAGARVLLAAATLVLGGSEAGAGTQAGGEVETTTVGLTPDFLDTWSLTFRLPVLSRREVAEG